MKRLIVILGDQLNARISSLSDCDKANDTILMCELQDEASYVRHHQKKIAFIFSAMRHFAQELELQGYQVCYVTLDHPQNTGSFFGEVKRAVAHHHADRIVVTEPGEYRVLQDIQQWEAQIGVPVEICADNRFLCDHATFSDWAKGRKQLRMEFFYRDMRKRYGVLMQGDQPEGGKWNYDAENRKPPKDGLNIPVPFQTTPDALSQEVISLVQTRFADHFGNLEPFYFAVTRDDALKLLAQFIDERLPYFGDYQDAMIENEPWMYHSHISFYLNCGLLLPMECIEAAEHAYHQGNAPLNAAEGFIRQIMGWREFVRGVYWLKMPHYKEMNFFHATRDLPDFYWTGETKMNCLKQCITETKQNAYAHHIQRLMVLGNFVLIAGINPDQVNEWYLIVYADAYEWVELPNVSGMVLFADGGYLASKPYAAGGSYINKMSDYCQNCRYKPTIKNGEEACPFNYLYWDFLMRNREALKNNHRMGMVYKTLDRMDYDKVQMIATDAAHFLRSLDHDNPR